ncbi:VirB4-like conjugal transfer ATPase, CD1110 family [Patescibacteria group bacterium]
MAKLTGEKLSKEEIARRETVLEAERVYRKGLATVKDIIAPSAIQITPSFIRIGDRYARTLFMYVYPRFLQTSWFSPIINMNQTMDISMFMHAVETEELLKKLRNKVGQIQTSIMMNEEKGAVRDPVLDTAYQDVEDLRDKLQQGTEKLFRYSLYITVYGRTKRELDKVTEQVESVLSTKLVYSKHAMMQMEQGFASTSPVGVDKLKVETNLNTAPLSTTFPFVSNELSSNDGILYGINRHNSSLILFDRFAMENANMVIFAKSGAGKSYATKLEILRSLMLGTDVIIIDPENEYKYLSDAVGGGYLEISLNADNRINPFDLPRGIGSDNTADILRSATVSLIGLMNLMLGELTPEEDSIMDTAITQAYAKKDITPETDLGNIEVPTMQDLEEILMNMEGGENLALRLQKYTQGTFAGVFNQPTNVEMDNQLVVFSIRDLEDEMRPIGMYVILTYIWNIVRSKLKRRILVVDEAWWMMQYEDSAKFLFGLAKRARKYYLGVSTISQDVADFLHSDYGKAIVTNSSLQLLLKQSPASIDLVADTFNLTDGEKYLLLESDVGEGIFFAGQKHVAIKVQASYTEDQIITSDPRQILEIEQAKQEFAASQEEQEDGAASAGDSEGASASAALPEIS